MVSDGRQKSGVRRQESEWRQHGIASAENRSGVIGRFRLLPSVFCILSSDSCLLTPDSRYLLINSDSAMLRPIAMTIRRTVCWPMRRAEPVPR